jgi:WD40 repeat protein
MDIEGSTLVTGSKGFNGIGCEVKVWDLRNPSTPVYNLTGHTQDVTDCYVFDGKAFSVSKDGSYGLWDTLTGSQLCLSSRSGKVHMCIAGGLQKSEVSTVTIGSFDGSLQRIQIGWNPDNKTSVCQTIACTSVYYDAAEDTSTGIIENIA